MWAVKNTVLLQKIVYLTKKAVRIITNSYRCAHTHPLFRRLSILKTEELHKLQIACFMYKIYKCLLPSYFSAMFCLNETIHPYATRPLGEISRGNLRLRLKKIKNHSLLI